jgi:lipopolysaccharide export system permease protein
LFRWLPLDRIDRYVLRLIAGPLALSLVALLLAQLLERLLRLFDLAASAGAPPSSVLVMASTLVPHYLGLALPMAFTAAIFMAVARMCDDNELDMMLVAGRSIARIAAPYFMLALMLSLFSVYLYGQLQPLARYGYHVAVNQVLQTGWDARVEENHFLDIGQGVTFTADVIEPDGRGLRGVFMERRGANSEQILTAARGRIVSTPEGLQLKLEDGLVVNENDHKASLSISRFETGFSANDFTPKPQPMEARGASVRERTLAELWRDMHLEGGETKPAAEFHSRLARALIFPFLPLLALPLGMASKRGRRAPGVIFGVLALLAIDHALQLGESLADTGRLPAAAAVWVPYAVFVGLSLWIFRGSLAWPGDNPVLRAVVAVEGLIDRARPRTRQSTP